MIARGKFSVVVKAAEKANTENLVAAKLFEYSHDTLHQVNTEFDNLRSLRHERIASLLEAYKPSTTASNIAVLVMEKLQGADVLSYLSSRHEYTEQNVATIISQVLDGLQYLHWRGLCHLNIEPDNVVMASVRSVQVKLIDLGCTQRVTKLGTLIHPINTPNPEFAAPEVLAEEPIFPQTDVWSAGVLAYVLLSGASPFRGQSEPETRQNVNFVRYRFEYLFKELTQEATRFLMLIFKRAPGKRPTVEECHENRWLVPSEYMIKKRERAVFLGNRLKEFSDEYHDLKNKQFTSDSLSSLHKTLTRSNSIQEELISTAFTSHLVNKPSSDSSTL
ncbi:hypothetical protein M8J75_012474 [Diaphorina citri]|nr:hypothetical protein M8J75_012474 [Diaphorina citri]